MLMMDDRFLDGVSMDEGFVDGVSIDMLDFDNEFDDLSIDYDEFYRIMEEESASCSQSIPGALSIGQVPCDESVADIACQENLQIQFGLQELKTEPLVGSPKHCYSTEHDIWGLGKVSDCNNDFDTNCFNNDVKSENVDFRNSNKISMEFLETPEICSSVCMDTSHYEICSHASDMCETGNHYSQLQCHMGGGNVNNLDHPFTTDMNDVKDNCFMENASIQVKRISSSVSDMSGNIFSEAEGCNPKFEFCNENPSSSELSMSNTDDKLTNKSLNSKPLTHTQSCIISKKKAFCINDESTEPVAYEKPHCFAHYLSDDIITKSPSAAVLIRENDLKMSVSASGPSISNSRHAVTVNVKDDAFIPSKQAYSQDTLDETAGISFIDEDQNRCSGHVGHDAKPANFCELPYCLIDESVGEENHPNRMGSHLSKVSPESTQSNSLDNKFVASAEENDICIIEEISQPVQSITKRESRATSQCFLLDDSLHSMGVGGMRLRSSEQLVLQVALQSKVFPYDKLWLSWSFKEDLSQQMYETSPPDGLLVVPLFRHQRIALSWMVHKETSSWNCVGGILADDQGLGKTISVIALLLKERSPPFKVCPNVTKPGELATLNLDEEHDAIHDSDEVTQFVSSSEIKGRLSSGTLIVCPTSVLRQWADELKHKVSSKADLSVLIYHGSNRTKDPCELAKYDVVLTTYSIVSMEVPKQPLVENGKDEVGCSEADDSSLHLSSSKKRKYNQIDEKGNLIGVKEVNNGFIGPIIRPLAKVQWFRVVLDEAQSIKNYRTQVARACWGLRAKRRWCLSGTPIQNAIDDLYSYFRFLKYDPFCSYKIFCEKIKVPINRNPAKGFRKLQAVLKTIMLRRTKGTLLEGEPIITLPPKSVELRKVDFSKVERDFYTKLENEARAQFEEYAAAGTVKQNYVNILLMLLRLRQACDHPLLVKKFNSHSVWKSSVESARKLPRETQSCLLHCLEASLAICGICNDPPEDAVVSICGHVFCNQCISEHLTGDGNQCPAQNCKLQLNVFTVFSKATLNSSLSDQLSIPGDTPDFCGSNLDEAPDHCFESFFDSSKIRAALKVLESLDTQPKDSSFQSNTSKASGAVDSAVGEKAIVFSQWTKMLDLLEACLKKSCIQYRRLDGTMSVAARDKAVRDFNTRPEVCVMIMSLKAASLGLNMVAACHVIMMDLWWNPTTEDQAIDRAHRIGQMRPVTVVRLTVKDTVEDRILALQEKKRVMVSSAFGEDGSGGRDSRLTVEELKYLFMA